MVLLLQTEQYKPALDLASSLREDNQNSFQIIFGMAYALYRLNREKEASDVVKTLIAKGDYEDRGLIHMKAQIVCFSIPPTVLLIKYCAQRNTVVEITKRPWIYIPKFMIHLFQYVFRILYLLRTANLTLPQPLKAIRRAIGFAHQFNGSTNTPRLFAEWLPAFTSFLASELGRYLRRRTTPSYCSSRYSFYVWNDSNEQRRCLACQETTSFKSA